MFIYFIIPMAIAIGIYLLILKGINKFIFKGNRKIDFKEFIIGWAAIFIINLFLVLTKTKFAIGIRVNPFADLGAERYYVSLGYIIHVKEDIWGGLGDLEDEVVEFYIPPIWKLFNSDNKSVRNTDRIDVEIKQ